MSRKESDFLKRLLATFQAEAAERIQSLESGLIALEDTEQESNRAEIVEQAFREVHSLKGAARSVNLMEIEAVCQAMEDVFAAMKRQTVAPTAPLLDVLHQATNTLKELLPPADAEVGSQDKSRQLPLIRRLKELAKQSKPLGSISAPARPLPARPIEPPTTELPPKSERVEREALSTGTAAETVPPHDETDAPQPDQRASHPAERSVVDDRSSSAPETVRIATSRLESLLLQTEELVSAKLAISQRASELRDVQTSLDAWDKQWAKVYPLIRTLSQTAENGQRPSELAALLEFVEWNHTWVQQMDRRLTAISNATNRDQRTIGSMIDHLLQDMKQVLMLPFSSILEAFPRTVRDLTRQRGKEVHFEVYGGEIEVDRRILQELKDPLMHLIRNCIDHGIEMPEVRQRLGKPRRGTITLTITQRDSSKFEVTVEDDGSGIDLEKVRNTATRLGIISPDHAERLSNQETKGLIFQSGLSTSPMITDISGRGLGLAIVQEKVEKLGGVIVVETSPKQGTSFRFTLPLTLATLRGLLVCSEGHTLVLPIIHVERVARVSRSEIQTVQNRETIQLAGQTYSLVRLGQVLELPLKNPEPPDRIFVVIVSAGDRQIACWVDEIIAEQEVLVKPLGPQLARVRNIAGATVLGNGQVIPILNVADLVKSAIRAIDTAPAVVEALPNQHKNILIVEDSITARMQLKNILELNGYAVTSAVDGLDALMMLRSQDFDLVVSDVDMPRLNGFDLTNRIRTDKQLADLPVILVTTLASREDQERGIEVGANAYITKSNFDQNTLLEAIRRLI